jgi:flagellar basal-body rod modification protein FlgD
MNSIAPNTLSSQVVKPQGSSNKLLDQTAFLRLMTTQLKAQDPFNPMDNTQMVAQMAQFSSVAGISEMNTSLKSIANQLASQTELLADIKAATTTPPSNPSI